MKYDLNKKATRGAQRTLDAFANGMFHMLTKKTYEDINMNEICEYTNYPRATFYNYFDDKYDLLNYCWHCLSQQVHLEEHEDMNPKEILYVFFDRIYDLIESKNDIIKIIIQHNSETSYMFSSFKVYMMAQVRAIFDKCPLANEHSIPYGIVSDHYCNTLLLVIEWCFWKEKKLSKSQAHEYLKYLIGNL